MKLQGAYVQVPDALMQSDLTPAEKLVYISLLHFAGEEGTCWPSVHAIAVFCHVDDRTVQRSIVTLQKKKWIKEKRRSHVKTYFYELSTHHIRHSATGGNLSPMNNEPTKQVSLPKGDILPPTGVTSCHPGGDILPPELIFNEPDSVELIQDPPPTSPRPTKPSKTVPNYSISFDYSAGEFVMTEAARQKLDRDWPDVDVDVEIRKAEAWVLDVYNQKGRTIQNGLSFLSKWLGKPGAQKKSAGKITLTSGALAGKTLNVTYGGASQANKRPTPPPVDVSKMIKGD